MAPNLPNLSPRLIGGLIAGCVATFFLVCVWPTPYRFQAVEGPHPMLFRINRITGAVRCFDSRTRSWLDEDKAGAKARAEGEDKGGKAKAGEAAGPDKEGRHGYSGAADRRRENPPRRRDQDDGWWYQDSGRKAPKDDRWWYNES